MAQFIWQMDGKGYSHDPCPVLMHKPSGYYFLFCTPEGGRDSWQFKCTPGISDPAESNLYGEGWPRILQRFGRWCTDLKRELEEPDLWGSVNSFDLNSFKIEEDSNTPFTYSEVVELKGKVQLVVDFVHGECERNGALAAKQDKILASLARLQAHAESGIGRIDWINLLIGALISIVIAGAFAPERTREFLDFIKATFGTALRLVISG